MRNQVFSVDGDRSNVSNVAIIITDGKPTDPSTVPAAIDAVHNSGTSTLVVGVTDQVDEATLRQLSSAPSEVSRIYHRRFTKKLLLKDVSVDCVLLFIRDNCLIRSLLLVSYKHRLTKFCFAAGIGKTSE